MNCLPDEILRAKLDNELGETERSEAKRHLDLCEECRRRMEGISRRIEEAGQWLSALSADAPPEVTDPSGAFTRFRARLSSESVSAPPRRNVVAGFFSRHPVPAWGGAAVVALIILLVTLAPARSWAQKVLAMLRVEKVTVVPVDFNVTPGSDTQALVRQVISNDVTVTLSAGKPQIVTDASQASKLAGFPIRVLNGSDSAPRIGVTGEQAYVMTLDQSRLQEILNSLGRPDLQIPSSVNGEAIAVHIPKSVFLRYGNCPARRERGMPGASGAPGPNSAPARAGSCISLAEVPSPVVSVPPGLNINQLFQIALEAAGMSPQEAQAFCQTVDWKSTLVVPIPRRASSYVEEEVDGVEGDLIVGPTRQGRPPEFALIWIKDGIIYSIHGYGDPQRALALAGSLS
jgi:anti-sigma factor RsiW